MRNSILVLLLPLPLTMLSGCVSTAAAVVKAPFQVAGKAVDWSTTSQEEADRNYGRKMRKAEAREGMERREYEKECRKHPDGETCARGYQGYVAGRD